VINNWEKYRCNPLIIPFASYFGHDSEDTMQQCLHKNFKSSSPHLFNPFLNTLNSMASTFESAGFVMGNLNTMVDGVSNMFQNSFSSILDRLNDVGSATQYLMIKLKTILERLAATVLLIIYSLYTVLQGLLAIKKDRALINAVDRLTSKQGLI
jgi:hypothetical protein